MFNDSVSFNGGTRVEVIAVLANCGRDTDRARRALVTWIRHKQDKGRSTEHILVKLQDIESKFIKDTSLHSAFRDARAETFLPRAPDLPLPSPVRRRSVIQTPGSEPPTTTSIPNIVGPSTISPSSAGPPPDLTPSPLISPLRLSQGSSEISPGNPNTNRPILLPQSVTQSHSPRIQIPRDRSRQLAPDSPITSSPEESGPYFRHRYTSDSLGPSSFHGLPTPPSASPPEFRFSPIPPRSQRNIPASAQTPSSEESVPHPKYRPTSITPIRRRATAPRTSPPDLPLPPIPSDDQYVDSRNRTSKKVLPPTPVQSPSFASTPARQLAIQSNPSRVPSSDKSEYIHTISGNSTRQYLQESNGEPFPPENVVRRENPVFVPRGDHPSRTGTGPPPPYVVQLDTHSPPDMPKFGETLDRAVNICGGSPEVRLEVAKCIGFHRGYEPPYWQTRLQGCGLNVEASKYLVDEMCKQVDWSTSFGRVTRT